MEIKIKKTVEDTIEITLPKFWKNIRIGGIELLGAIDEKNVILFDKGATHWVVRSFSAWVLDSNIYEAYKNWEEIAETEFFDRYEEQMKLLTMQPVTDGTR